MNIGFFISLGFKGGKSKVVRPSGGAIGGGGQGQTTRITQAFILSHYDDSTETLDFTNVRLSNTEIEELSSSSFLPTVENGSVKFTDSGYNYASNNATIVSNFSAKGWSVTPNVGRLGISKLGEFILSE